MPKGILCFVLCVTSTTLPAIAGTGLGTRSYRSPRAIHRFLDPQSELVNRLGLDPECIDQIKKAVIASGSKVSRISVRYVPEYFLAQLQGIRARISLSTTKSPTGRAQAGTWFCDVGKEFTNDNIDEINRRFPPLPYNAQYGGDGAY